MFIYIHSTVQPPPQYDINSFDDILHYLLWMPYKQDLHLIYLHNIWNKICPLFEVKVGISSDPCLCQVKVRKTKK